MSAKKKSIPRIKSGRSAKKATAAIRNYRLSGPQVEPESSYWNRCPIPCPVSLAQLTAWTDDPANPHYFSPYPTDPQVVRREFDELLDLQRRRNDPTQVSSTIQGRERLPISTFLQLRPPPIRGGGIVNMAREDSFPVFFTGSELARFFENNTPGLAHRHALNYLIHDTNWSPPRQALVWTALDITIYSALLAAWYYKWLSPRPNTSRRQRPIEYAIDNGFANTDEDDRDDAFKVLFDRAVNTTGTDSDGHRPNFPPVTGFIHSSPGTPRHPAYPSGHSTYGAAASELLSFFFPDYRRDLDFLADNTGIARLWAGIHWRSDHLAGMKLGRAVACLVIEQLRRSGIPLVPPMRPETETPPSRTQLQTQADAFAANCGQATPGAVPGLRRPVSEPCVPPGERGVEPETDTSDTRGESFVG
jgi:membrane-associated phospholipid phosphatase